ncbi:hypothetical protein Lser_V15G03064 [Lactuca serriola]
MRALVFDEYFSRKFAKNGSFGSNGFIRIINLVLFLHRGPILKFHLHIPTILLDSFKEVDQWTLVLSRKGVTELVLTNSDRHYQLSFMFSCVELTNLHLRNCFFNPPLEFEGFLHLKKLYLKDIVFRDNLCGTHINFPQLNKLFWRTCTDSYNFNIKATKLQGLKIASIKDSVPVERINLVSMLSNLPKIEVLSIDGESLEDVIEENMPKWLPYPVKSLKCLNLQDMKLRELCQLHGVLCLLPNSSNVESLWMELWRLQIVEMTVVKGSRMEILFIRLLLAHSPSLKKFTITSCGACGVDISKDVMQFPRA